MLQTLEMAELAEQRLKAFEEEFSLIRTHGKGQSMLTSKPKAGKASGQLLTHTSLCLVCLIPPVTCTPQARSSLVNGLSRMPRALQAPGQ